MSNDKTAIQAQLEEAIVANLEFLDGCNPDTREYAQTLEQLEKLRSIHLTFDPERIEEKKNKAILKDWIPVIGSVGGILTIVVFEGLGHTVTTKALGFVTKVKS